MIPVFDKIFLRESISVNIRTLTYMGLEDFGERFEAGTTEKTNHALVLMVQSLDDNTHQPIAVFASKEHVKGDFNFKLELNIKVKTKLYNSNTFCRNKFNQNYSKIHFIIKEFFGLDWNHERWDIYKSHHVKYFIIYRHVI